MDSLSSDIINLISKYLSVEDRLSMVNTSEHLKWSVVRDDEQLYELCRKAGFREGECGHGYCASKYCQGRSISMCVYNMILARYEEYLPYIMDMQRKSFNIAIYVNDALKLITKGADRSKLRKLVDPRIMGDLVNRFGLELDIGDIVIRTFGPSVIPFVQDAKSLTEMILVIVHQNRMCHQINKYLRYLNLDTVLRFAFDHNELPSSFYSYDFSYADFNKYESTPFYDFYALSFFSETDFNRYFNEKTNLEHIQSSTEQDFVLNYSHLLLNQVNKHNVEFMLNKDIKLNTEYVLSVFELSYSVELIRMFNYPTEIIRDAVMLGLKHERYQEIAKLLEINAISEMDLLDTIGPSYVDIYYIQQYYHMNYRNFVTLFERSHSPDVLGILFISGTPDDLKMAMKELKFDLGDFIQIINDTDIGHLSVGNRDNIKLVMSSTRILGKIGLSEQLVEYIVNITYSEYIIQLMNLGYSSALTIYFRLSPYWDEILDMLSISDQYDLNLLLGLLDKPIILNTILKKYKFSKRVLYHPRVIQTLEDLQDELNLKKYKFYTDIWGDYLYVQDDPISNSILSDEDHIDDYDDTFLLEED